MIGVTVVAASVLAALARATAPAQNGEIAFVRRSADTSSAIYVVRSDGSRERRLTRPPATFRDDRPDWAPRGAAVVFERCAPSGRCQIYTVESDGTRARRLGPPCPKDAGACSRRAPALSPDGRRIAFLYTTSTLSAPSGAAALVVADASLRRSRFLAWTPTLLGSADAPTWSPDGTRLAFGVIRGEGTGVTPSDGRALFVIGADGKGLRRVTPWSLRAGDRPDWAPDGGHVLVRSESHRHAGFGSNLYTVRADGSGLRRLTRFPASRRVLSGTYAPDGTAIAIATTEGSTGLPDIYVIGLDGGDARPVTRSPEWDGSPDWGPRR